jgi:hypothetical protein
MVRLELTACPMHGRLQGSRTYWRESRLASNTRTECTTTRDYIRVCLSLIARPIFNTLSKGVYGGASDCFASFQWCYRVYTISEGYVKEMSRNFWFHPSAVAVCFRRVCNITTGVWYVQIMCKFFLKITCFMTWIWQKKYCSIDYQWVTRFEIFGEIYNGAKLSGVILPVEHRVSRNFISRANHIPIPNRTYWFQTTLHSERHRNVMSVEHNVSRNRTHHCNGSADNIQWMGREHSQAKRLNKTITAAKENCSGFNTAISTLAVKVNTKSQKSTQKRVKSRPPVLRKC